MHEKNRPAFGVKAERARGGDGWVAIYWAPGITPGMIRDGTAPAIFDSKTDAENSASARLFDVLNAPRDRNRFGSSKVESYVKLTGAEFAELLRETVLAPTEFAHIYGTSNQRVFSWIDGVNNKGEPQDIPHPARVLLEIFKHNPETVQLAKSVTEAVKVSRRADDRGAAASTT